MLSLVVRNRELGLKRRNWDVIIVPQCLSPWWPLTWRKLKYDSWVSWPWYEDGQTFTLIKMERLSVFLCVMIETLWDRDGVSWVIPMPHLLIYSSCCFGIWQPSCFKNIRLRHATFVSLHFSTIHFFHFKSGELCSSVTWLNWQCERSCPPGQVADSSEHHLVVNFWRSDLSGTII